MSFINSVLFRAVLITALLLKSSAALGASDAVQAEAGFSYETLTRGFSDWKSAYLNLSSRLAPRNSIYGSVRWTERFDLSDEEATAGIYLPAGEKYGLHFEGSLSPSYNVLPIYSLLGEVERTIQKSWVVHAGVRSTGYENADTLIGILALERYVGGFRASYTFYESYLLWDTASASHRLSADYYYGEKSSIGISGTLGREAERVLPDRVLISDVAALSIPGIHYLTPKWAISYEAGIHRQGDSYTKRGVRIGIRRVF